MNQNQNMITTPEEREVMKFLLLEAHRETFVNLLTSYFEEEKGDIFDTHLRNKEWVSTYEKSIEFYESILLKVGKAKEYLFREKYVGDWEDVLIKRRPYNGVPSYLSSYGGNTAAQAIIEAISCITFEELDLSYNSAAAKVKEKVEKALASNTEKLKTSMEVLEAIRKYVEDLKDNALTTNTANPLIKSIEMDILNIKSYFDLTIEQCLRDLSTLGTYKTVIDDNQSLKEEFEKTRDETSQIIDRLEQSTLSVIYGPS